MEDLVQRASHYATRSHRRINHRRKYTGQPYEVHLRAVARIVETVTDDAQMIAAAWLHDVVEDTPATFRDVEAEFGGEVVALVTDLTDVSRPSDGNRAVRRAIDRAHLSQASERAQTVKLADLIDNCRDICKHDEEFGKVFLVEMAALLEVLVLGDAGLMKEARRILEENAESLRVPLPTISTSERQETPALLEQDPGQRRTWRLFANNFTTQDVARPLRSFDAARPAAEVAEVMREHGLLVAGVREAGVIVGHARLAELTGSSLGACSRPMTASEKIEAGASLTEMIQLLTRHDTGFVVMFGGVNGIVTRDDVQHPIVRMWLFGMVTLIEMTITARIEGSWPEDAWKEHLSPARLAKAEELRAERQRRGQRCTLLDCTQIGDKASVLVSDPGGLKFLGFESKKAARKAIKEFESLRNNLAHSQDIVTHDWPQIARLTARVESMLGQD